jgi:hypothetical protein
LDQLTPDAKLIVIKEAVSIEKKKVPYLPFSQQASVLMFLSAVHIFHRCLQYILSGDHGLYGISGPLYSR